MIIFGSLLTKSRKRILIAGFFGCFLLAMLFAWRVGVTVSALENSWKMLNDYLQQHPWCLFLAIVFLPGLPIPTSPLLFTAGIVWRSHPVIACLLCIVAMSLNLTWTYWLAAGIGRNFVERVLLATKMQIPELPVGDHLKLILILKLTPGIPFFVQNYLCGFLRAPFLLYLPISILCNGIIGTGIILSGAGLAGGKMMPALTGISLIVVGGVLTHLIRGWLAKRKRLVANGLKAEP